MELHQGGEARWITPEFLEARTVASGTGKQGDTIDDPPEPPPEKRPRS